MEASIKNDQVHSPSGNYELSRFNATRHGILSRHTVLPWESPEEYEELHRALQQEYEPMGPTEEHLVDEIAGIIWRKRRLRLAENAACRDQYRRVLTFESERIAESGLLDEGRLMTEKNRQELGKSSFVSSSNYGDDYTPYLEEIFHLTPEETARRLAEMEKDIRTCWEALEILKTANSEEYQLAVETLIPDTQKFWAAQVADQTYQPICEDLGKFLFWVIAGGRRHKAVLANLSSIRAQAQGESLNPERLEKFSRYEVSLDRKMEKTLTMLLKLQELRRERERVRE